MSLVSDYLQIPFLFFSPCLIAKVSRLSRGLVVLYSYSVFAFGLAFYYLLFLPWVCYPFPYTDDSFLKITPGSLSEPVIR